MNMGAFLSYSIMSGIAMLALYLAYRSLLAMDKQHGFNRAVLLLIYVVSFAASPFALGWADGAGNAGPQPWRCRACQLPVRPCRAGRRRHGAWS